MKGTLFHVRRFQRVEAVPRWTMPDVLSNNNEDHALQVLNSLLIISNLTIIGKCSVAPPSSRLT